MSRKFSQEAANPTADNRTAFLDLLTTYAGTADSEQLPPVGAALARPLETLDEGTRLRFDAIRPETDTRKFVVITNADPLDIGTPHFFVPTDENDDYSAGYFSTGTFIPWEEVEPDGSNEIAVDGTSGVLNYFGTITANVTLIDFTNLRKGLTYEVRLEASGGARTVAVDALTALGADVVKENFGGTTVSIASGARASFLIKVENDDTVYVRYTLGGGGSTEAASTTEVLTGTDNTKAVTSDALAALWEQGSNVASAATISLGEGGYFNVTGTTTITDIDFATDKAGRAAVLVFAGALTLTHGANLILPGAANILTAAGDLALVWSEGSDVVRVAYFRASGMPVAPIVGRTAIYVDAAQMVARNTSGAAYGKLETATNLGNFEYHAFDTAADEFVQFKLVMPKRWNEGTVTAKFHWSHPSTTTNFDVCWGIQALALANDDALEAAFGSAVTVTDAGGTTDDLYTSPETGAFTVAGSPGAEELVLFQVYRDVDGNGTAGDDDLAVDARLHGVTLYITTDAPTDA